MNKRILLVGALILPGFIYAQTYKVKSDSVKKQDLSLAGIIDLSDLNDEMQDDEGTGSQEINTTVLTSHDAYINNAGYNLSQFRFRLRGYNNHYEETFINGMPFNDQLRGVFNYSSIGAMNNITRNGDKTNYTMPGTFTFGSIGGSGNILMRAGDYGRGGQTTLSYTNRNYNIRAMAHASTGLSKDGWALTALIGGRYSNEGNVKGTFYRNFSYALLLEKQFNNGRHRLNFTTFGSPVVRGQQNGSMQEVYNLTGDNLYNSNWGYQNGKKRNSRVVKAIDPTAILSYEGKLSKNVTLNTGASFHFGKYGKSALGWYNGADPRPDYYRNLPSYYRAGYEQKVLEGMDPNSSELQGYLKGAEYLEELWRSGDKSFTQVNWDRMIDANRNNVRYGDGSAVYMVEERRSDLYETALNATLNAKLNAHNKVTVGLMGRNTISHQYKKVDDLLGANYLLDIDKYSERDFPGDLTQCQKDLRHPNRRVTEGGIFDYDFKLHVNSVRGWVNNQYSRGHLEGYYGMQLTHTDFFRDGKMQNGHNPNNSYGVGKHHTFTDLMAKAGFTYKINGSHLLQFNTMYGQEAPLANDAYVFANYTDETADGLKSNRLFHADASYIFSTPKFSGRLSAYNTSFFDLQERSIYYWNGATLLTQILTGVHKVHRGIEAALTYRMNEHWSFDAAGTLSQYYYANNPNGQFSVNNGKSLSDYNFAEHERVYMKHVKVGGAPQIAGTLGARYFINYWFLGAHLNFISHNYIQATPARRTSSMYAGNSKTQSPIVAPENPDYIPYYNELYNSYRKFTDQERFGSAATIDLSIGKMFYVGRNQSINLNFAFNNITNRKNIKTGGYEQARTDLKRPNLFANKYFYMQGFNCYLNVSYKF